MEYSIPGYIVVFVSLALYSGYLIRRGRDLASKVPAEHARYFGDRS